MILLIIAAVVIVVAILYLYGIKKNVEKISMEMFGTRSLVEGLERQADELAETPKSVSGMTRLMEPQILKDFPEFQWLEFKARAENLLVSVFQAIDAQEESLLQGASEEVRAQVRQRIHENRTHDRREQYRRIRIHQTEILKYEKKQGQCVIDLQSSLEYLHYIEENGNVTEGDKIRLTQTKYNTELVYIQDAEQMGKGTAAAVICPNCGAPMKGLGAKFCEYCGSSITPINTRVWSFTRYYEV